MPTPSRKPPSTFMKILRIAGAVVVALLAWVAGAFVAGFMHILSPPIFVEKMPEIPSRLVSYAIKPPKPGSLTRQARDRTRNVLAAQSGVWRFSFPEVNAWLAANQGKSPDPAGSYSIKAGAPVVSERSGLVQFSGEAELHTPFGMYPVFIQAEGAFRPGVSGPRFVASSVRINTFSVPAFDGWLDASIDWAVSGAGFRGLPPEVWKKVTAITVDSSGVSLTLP